MGFRLVPKSVTLNDPERSNGRVAYVISPNLVALGQYYVKVVEGTPTHSASEMQPEEFLAVYHLWRYSEGSPPVRALNCSTPPTSSENLNIISCNLETVQDRR